LSIWSDGRVEYEGKDHVKMKGLTKSRITFEQTAKLIEAFNGINFFALRDQYQSTQDGCATVATDNPSVIISMKIGSRQKTLTHYHGCLETFEPYRTYPHELVEFEDKIDEIVGTSEWTGIN
jgi:hypothetical protein